MGVSVKINSIARIRALGDAAVTVEFGDSVDRALSERVMAARRAIEAAAVRGVVEVVPTFRSLAVCFDPVETSFAEIVERIGAITLPETETAATGRTIVVPVLYDGPDLDAVASAVGMSPEEVAALHASRSYHVYMLGFLPGFAYLGDLPDRLRLPRLKEPRTRVPAGAVAIADQMTAIYPVQSPGGWHLIGRSPLKLFDYRKDSPSLLLPGDEVRFARVDAAEFERLAVGAEVA